jgi:hypothetical protein
VSEPKRHHYIPIFYTKRWTGPDNRLCEYSKPWKEIKAKRKHPAAVGYVDGLYTQPNAPPDQKQIIETNVLAIVDNWASHALTDILKHAAQIDQLDPRKKGGWIQFLYSLLIRNPEHLARIRTLIDEVGASTEYKARFTDDPAALAASRALPELLSDEKIISAIAAFTWIVKSVDSAKHTLLTSDRPIVMTTGLLGPNAHIVLPISPRRVFIASGSTQKSKAFENMPANEFVKQMNDTIFSQAVRYVYGTDDIQLR